MAQTVEAVYENGVIRPARPLNLPEHTRLRVTITPLPERIISLRGLWKSAGELRDEDLEAARRLWDREVEEQLQTLKGASE